MRIQKLSQSQQGFALVEAILAASLLVILFAGILGALFYGIEGTQIGGKRTQASQLAEEGIEAVRNIKSTNYATFAALPNGTYGLGQSGGTWTLIGGTPDTIDGYTRTITLSTNSIASRDVSVKIDWQQNLQRNGQLTVSSRLTNWSGLSASWSTPAQAASRDISGNNNGWKIAVSGNYAYVVLSSGSPNLFVFDISNPASPTQIGSLALTGNPRDIEIAGNFAYIASDSNASELQIVNIATPASPTLSGSYNATGNENANSVAIGATNQILLGRDSGAAEFIVVGVTNPALPTTVGTLNMSSTVSDVKRNGNYAYVASDNDTQELQVVNITNASIPSQVGSFNNPGNDNGRVVSIFGASVLLGMGTTGDVAVLGITDPTAPVQQGLYNGTDDIRDIAIDTTTGLAFLATDANNSEFEVLDISNLATPSLLGAFDISGNNDLNGLAYVASSDRVFTVGDSNSEELVVLRPGP